jgi:hypothetical protein
MRAEAGWHWRRGAGILTLGRDHVVSLANDGLEVGLDLRSCPDQATRRSVKRGVTDAASAGSENRCVLEMRPVL